MYIMSLRSTCHGTSLPSLLGKLISVVVLILKKYAERNGDCREKASAPLFSYWCLGDDF